MRSNSSVPRRRRVRRLLKRAKGFVFGRGRHKAADETIKRAEAYSTMHRQEKKRNIKRLWMLRISAAARSNGMKYSTFVCGLKKAGLTLNTKTLSKIAFDDAKGFAQLVEKSKKANPK
jgi:large subunit ribosomal protein L20